MKVVILTTHGHGYMNYFLSNNLGLELESYAVQKKKLNEDGQSWGYFWSNALSPLGYELTEIVANIKSIQVAYAKENDIAYNDKDWMLQIAEKQILKIKPEVLFITDYVTFRPQWIKQMRNKCKSIKLILGWCGASYTELKVIRSFDIILSCIPELVTQFRGHGFKSELVSHAFDPVINNMLDVSTEPYIDFSFIGSIIRNNEMHLGREELLKEIAKEVPIKIYSPSAYYGVIDDVKAYILKFLYSFIKLCSIFGSKKDIFESIPLLNKAIGFNTMPKVPVDRKLKKYFNPPVYGVNKYQIMRDSKINFNSHIDLSLSSASNMRLFEVTGVGGCLLTDWKANIGDFFEPEKEVVTYKSHGECVEKVKWLLDNPKEREAIAKAGQARCLKDHTFASRAEVLDGIIKKALSQI